MLQMRKDHDMIERELRTTRESISSLLDATARIGHFSARLAESPKSKAAGDAGSGGRRDYEAVGKAWEKLHKFLSRTSSTIFINSEDEAHGARRPDDSRMGISASVKARNFRAQASGVGARAAHSPHSAYDSLDEEGCSARGKTDAVFDMWDGDETHDGSSGDEDGAEETRKHNPTSSSPHRKARKHAGSREERKERPGTGVVSQRLRECMGNLTLRKREAPVPSV